MLADGWEGEGGMGPNPMINEYRLHEATDRGRCIGGDPSRRMP